MQLHPFLHITYLPAILQTFGQRPFFKSIGFPPRLDILFPNTVAFYHIAEESCMSLLFSKLLAEKKLRKEQKKQRKNGGGGAKSEEEMTMMGASAASAAGGAAAAGGATSSSGGAAAAATGMTGQGEGSRRAFPPLSSSVCGGDSLPPPPPFTFVLRSTPDTPLCLLTRFERQVPFQVSSCPNNRVNPKRPTDGVFFSIP